MTIFIYVLGMIIAKAKSLNKSEKLVGKLPKL